MNKNIIGDILIIIGILLFLLSVIYGAFLMHTVIGGIVTAIILISLGVVLAD